MVAFAQCLLLLAFVATVGLAVALLPQNVPGGGHNRSAHLVMCAIAMLPRWLCVTGALLICARAGPAPWAGPRGEQYAAIVAAQLVLGVGCAFCLMTSYESRRPLELPSLAFAAVPVVVPLWVTAFAWRLLMAGPGASPTPVRVGWIALGATAFLFVFAGLGAYLYDEARRARERAETASIRSTYAADRLAADEARFRALTDADPLPAWLEFIQYDTPAETKAAAVAGIARRPTLAADVRAELATKDYMIEGRAMSLFGRLPAATSVGLIDVFREYGRWLVAEEEAAVAEPTFERMRDRFAYASARANAFADAGRALVAAGVDVRPELDAVADVARGRDCDGARDIVRVYDCDRAEFARHDAAKERP